MRVADRLGRARRVLAITGPGLAALAVPPVHLGPDGLLEGGSTDSDLVLDPTCTAELLRWRPELVWKELRRLERACRATDWSRGHQVLQEMERFFGADAFLLLTENVDGLHGKAGSRSLVEIRGGFDELRCTICNRREAGVDGDRLPPLPECPDCGGLLRPGVVLHGEPLPAEGLRRLRAFFEAGVDVCLGIGAIGLCEQLAGPLLEIQRHGALCAEIGLHRPSLDHWAQAHIALRPDEALDRIWNRVLGLDGGDAV